jgi:hypothetical protein
MQIGFIGLGNMGAVFTKDALCSKTYRLEMTWSTAIGRPALDNRRARSKT